MAAVPHIISIAPNPTGREAVIMYRAVAGQHIHISIPGRNGIEIFRRVDTEQGRGIYSVVLDGNDAQPRAYLCTFPTDGHSSVTSIIIT